jgi:hypothetical protein
MYHVHSKFETVIYIKIYILLEALSCIDDRSLKRYH